MNKFKEYKVGQYVKYNNLFCRILNKYEVRNTLGEYDILYVIVDIHTGRKIEDVYPIDLSLIR